MSIMNMSQAGFIQPVSKGTLIFREGDQGVEMFILLKGAVEISTKGVGGKKIKLADIVQGGFFGEMSLLLDGHYRTATAAASTDSILMVITRNNFNEIVSKNPEVALRIMKGFAVRIRDLNKRLKEIGGQQEVPAGAGEIAGAGAVADAGMEEANAPDTLDTNDASANEAAADGPGSAAENVCEPAAAEDSFDEVGPELSKALQDLYFFNKEITCPVCGSKFHTMLIRESRLKQKERTDDLRVLFLDIEPLLYNIWICPECYYAMRSSEFAKVDEIQKKSLANHAARRKEAYSFNFTGRRTLGFAIKAYKMAVDCCESLGKNKVDERMAGLWFNIAWLYDDLQEAEKAKLARANALSSYKNAYMMSAGSDKNDQKVEYLIGKLSWSLGNQKDAREYMLKAVGRRDGHPLIKQLARDGLEKLKNEAE